MRRKYLSLRAMGLHVALICWIALCLAAAWWQVGRAVQGNALSYLYSIEWPVIGLLGVLAWYSMLNMEKTPSRKSRNVARTRRRCAPRLKRRAPAR